MLDSKKVSQTLWDFHQILMKSVFQGIEPLTCVPQDAEARMFALFQNLEHLSAQEVEDFSASEKSCLHTLLTQYTMFFAMFPELPFPDDFLSGSNTHRLGKAFLHYLAEHRWPFPQMLQRGKG